MMLISELRLRVITASRMWGADLPFRPGLNIVQAHNTSGKSTSLQAIIYALGLERSLGPQLTIPLPYSMRERIHLRKNDDNFETVLQSYVEIDIENSSGQRLSIRRDVVGGKDTKLVQAKITETTGVIVQRDFYVHDSGAAQRESGFHAYLANFIGWHLPTVPRFDGTECLLYLEALFPMFFVEQKRGWSAIQGPFPTYLKIQDVSRRAMEFLLDLDAGKHRRQRSELRSAINAVGQRWKEKKGNIDDQVQRVGRLREIRDEPTAEFAIDPQLTVEVISEEEWLPIATAIEETSERIRKLESIGTPQIEQVAPEIQEQLEATRQEVDELAAVLQVMRADISAERQEQYGLKVRLLSLNTDLLRNQDAFKLKRLGSELGSAAGLHVCPICHQKLAAELLPAVEGVGMGLEENISFVKSQIQLYETALEGSTAKLKELEARYRNRDAIMRERQATLRSLRQALIQPSSSLSMVGLQEIVRLQASLDRLISLEESTAIASEELGNIAKEWAALIEALKSVPSGDLSSSDDFKVTNFESFMQKKLAKYGFTSFRPTEIILSRDNFRPLASTKDEHGEMVEKEIAFEVSASDAIRLKWAYYLALLAVSTSHQTNHLGLVVFDEPGQQEVEASSLFSFFADSVNDADGRQVIVSTSATLEDVLRVAGAKASVISFEGLILQPM